MKYFILITITLILNMGTAMTENAYDHSFKSINEEDIIKNWKKLFGYDVNSFFDEIIQFFLKFMYKKGQHSGEENLQKKDHMK